jgi:hypothetical protein
VTPRTPQPVLGAIALEDTGAQEAAGHNVPLSGVQPLEPHEMPPDLVEELGRLLGQALAADIRQYPNLAEWKAARSATVESPPGHDRSEARRRTPACRPVRRQSARPTRATG